MKYFVAFIAAVSVLAMVGCAKNPVSSDANTAKLIITSDTLARYVWVVHAGDTSISQPQLAIWENQSDTFNILLNSKCFIFAWGHTQNTISSDMPWGGNTPQKFCDTVTITHDTTFDYRTR